MAGTILVKHTKQGREKLTLWVEGSAVHWSRSYTWKGTQEGKKAHGKPDKAQAALADEIEKHLASGFTYRDGPPKAAKPPPKPKASAARAVTKPKWLDNPALASARKKLGKLVKDAGLAHRFDEIEALAKPTIQFSLKKTANAPPGVSRLGGSPEVDVPGKLHFVAQIALAEVHALDLEGVLPARGLLSFFAQLDENRDDYAEVAKVVHSDTPAPRNAPSRTKGIGLLTPKLILTLPYYEDPAIDKLKLTDEEREAYHDEVYLTLMPEEPAHLLAGYGSSGTEHSLESRPFLAQFASDDRVGFNEGDDQTLRFYFKGKKPDLGAVVCTLEEA
jgi:hypothetical protein